jgi:hypothetical protein
MSALLLCGDALHKHVSSVRLASVKEDIARAAAQFGNSNCDLAGFGRRILTEAVGKPSTDVEHLTRVWRALLTKLSRLRSLEPTCVQISATCSALSKAGAAAWAERLKAEIATSEFDPGIPPDWVSATAVREERESAANRVSCGANNSLLSGSQRAERVVILSANSRNEFTCCQSSVC